MRTTQFELPKVTLTEEQLTDLISTAMGGTCGFDWWKLEDENLYKKAKEELIAEGRSEDDLCLEEVWARVIFNGGKLLLLEAESDWHWSGHEDGELLWSFQIQAEGCEPVGGTWKSVGLQEICNGLSKYMREKGIGTVDKLLQESDFDFYDADAVFQFAAYGEWIFG